MQGVRDAKTMGQNQLYEPCESLLQKYQSECFLDQAPRWFAYISQDPQKIIALCTEVKNTNNRLACYRGIARITPIGATKEEMLSKFCQPIVDQIGKRACQEELGIIEQ